MQKLVASLKRKTVWMFLFSFFIVALTSGDSVKRVLANSSEYNFFSASPSGETGGLAIPASCVAGFPENLYPHLTPDTADPTPINYSLTCNSPVCGNAGTIQCNGSCTATDPAWMGTACSSAPNNCGQTTTGVKNNCADSNACTAIRPADVTLGASCTSAANNCGQTTTGTMTCAGCNAVRPADLGVCPGPCTGATGSSCSGTNRWAYQCGCTASPGPGWVDQTPFGNPGCFNKNNGFDATCGGGPTCTGASGNFCNGTNTIDYQCGCTATPTGIGWVDQGNGCFHRNTGVACGIGCGDGICNGSETSCTCPSDCGAGTCGFPPAAASLYNSPWWSGTAGNSPATAIPSGSQAWLSAECFSGNSGNMWFFKNPTGPVPIPAILSSSPNYPSGGINGTQALVGFQWFHYYPHPTLANSFNPYSGGFPIGYGPHQPGNQRTLIDYPTGPLTNNTTYRVICWDSAARTVRSADKTVYVVGSNLPPVATITAPLAGSNHALGANIAFAGSATDPDPGDTIAAYQWWGAGCGLGSNFGNTASLNISTFPLGSHTVYFRAQDNRGLWSNCASTTFTVTTSTNNLPTAIITSPITPTPPVLQGTPINFLGLGTDVDGTVVGYEWRQGTLGQCQTRTGGTVLNSGATVGANTPLYTKSDFPVGIHTVYLSVQDNSGGWSTNCPSRLITVNGTIPGPPTLAHSCRVDIATGIYYADFSFTEPNSVRYHVGINFTANDTDLNGNGLIDQFNEWWKTSPPDWWLAGYVPTTYSIQVTPGDTYYWWAAGENITGLTGPSASGGTFACSPRTLQVCIDACDSNRPLPLLPATVGMNDNDVVGYNLVACFNRAAIPCTVAAGDVTNDPLTTWSQNLGPVDVATLTPSGLMQKLLPINPLAGPLPPWTKSERMRVTYGIFTQNWQVDVTKFCTSGCDPNRTANTCAGQTYPAPVDSCGRPEVCPGSRACDFNWKEIAP